MLKPLEAVKINWNHHDNRIHLGIMEKLKFLIWSPLPPFSPSVNSKLKTATPTFYLECSSCQCFLFNVHPVLLGCRPHVAPLCHLLAASRPYLKAD